MDFSGYCSIFSKEHLNCLCRAPEKDLYNSPMWDSSEPVTSLGPMVGPPLSPEPGDARRGPAGHSAQPTQHWPAMASCQTHP